MNSHVGVGSRPVGLGVDDVVGAVLVGADVGGLVSRMPVGRSEGVPVGPIVGSSDGALVGNWVGSADGDEVGSEEG